MSSSRKVTIEFLGQDKSLSKTANSIEGTTGKLGSRLKSIGKTAAVGFGAVAVGAVSVGTKLYQMGDEALDSRDRIGQIAESMGIFGKGADDVTDRLVKYADATARATGVDQNAIKATQAKLLTFKEIAKTADTAGGAFDRATMAAIDMAEAGFGTAESNAVGLGKALNDPIKGITALNKQGVTFNDAEKKRIETMVKAGKVGKAQAMILKAIETQVGGTAEAMAGPMDRFRVTMSQLGEQIGMKLVPVIDGLVTVFLDKALPAIMRFGGYLQDTLPPIFDKVRAVIAQFSGEGTGKLGKFMADVKAIWNDGVTIVTRLWQVFGKNIVGFLKGWVSSIQQIFKGVFQVIKGLFKVFSGALTGDWKKVWSGIKLIFKGVANVLVGLVKNLWNTIKYAFKNAGIILKAITRALWDGIKALTAKTWDGIKRLLSSALKAIIGYFRQQFGIAKAVLNAAWNAMKGATSSAWSAIKDKAREGAQFVVDKIREIPGKIRDLVGKFKEAGGALIGGIATGIKNAAGFATDFAGQIWTAVKSAINAGIDQLNNLLEFSFKVKGVGITVDAPDIGHLARGTNNWRGGLAVVGEQGPELVNLPRGSKVAPHGESMGMLRGMGGGGLHIHFHQPVAGDPRAFARAVHTELKKEKRLLGTDLGLA